MLTVCHLYPDLLNLYGDRGNVMAFVKRCSWRGLPVQVKEVNLGDQVEFDEYDFIFIGGGSDREQALMAADLKARVDAFCTAVDNGLVVLAICGGYQLLGRYYRTPEGREITGLGLLDIYTEAGDKRLIGNVVLETELAGRKIKLVGFENHGGKTYINGLEPLGSVLYGHGNNGQDGLEGARYKNVFCSYLHGPILPKNPVLTDHLIALALAKKGYSSQLTALDDGIENMANQAMVKRLLG
ncbi:type 1 glutamine amidotransferase [Desulfoscipio gibsoniae]|uniref:Lipid II isoglutaminyl synthase (glutamine-hydrolyzing) subunit GatD n=1 Tax=Desulfoscipio gibsoniae DSM 7213 TaxID=767817 RepID=R4KDJ5_9FIRM|nr:glutamine amidotransferase [Desulfoscipio gibsoniae]AGL01258.1 putative glutamine amidotransferase [Desulfoscipio gibsoniae DSM 7213]